jgi:hypothetical protein
MNINCTKCGKSSRYGHIDSLCIECYSQTHTSKQVRIRRNQERLFEHLDDLACVDCGEDDSRVLQFDHVRGVKHGDVAQMVISGYSWNRILEEIAKCEIVCANCHSKRTAQRGNFWRADVST